MLTLLQLCLLRIRLGVSAPHGECFSASAWPHRVHNAGTCDDLNFCCHRHDLSCTPPFDRAPAVWSVSIEIVTIGFDGFSLWSLIVIISRRCTNAEGC